MKRFKHTPAPWINVGGWVDAENNGIICSLSAVSMKSEDVDEANANLIAAAPELLVALIEIQQSLSNYIEIANNIGVEVTADGFYLGHAIEVEEKAKTAIAKALGETK